MGIRWYDAGFEEAKKGLPSDPPYQPGNRHYDAYLDGYADGESSRVETENDIGLATFNDTMS